ncbi:MAG: TetR/AcrR family transcriptional regulator [Bacillota bacterium]
MMDISLNQDSTIARRQEIIKAATRLFHELGYDHASTRELAKTVGLSNAGIYYHFKDKEDILFSILDGSVDKLIQSLKAAIKEGDDPQKNLTRITRNLLQVVMDDKMEIGLLTKESQRLSPEQLKSINKKKHESLKLIEKEVKRLANNGMLKPFNLTAASFSLVAMTNWTYFWFDPAGPLSIEELSKEITEIFFHGVLRDHHK